MKIIYMGTPDFAVGALEALIAGGHEVVCVLTQEDKPRGRGHAMQFPPVKEAALRAGIPVLQPSRMKDPALEEQLRAYGADVFVVAAYGKILPQRILDIPKYGCINIHASLLPAYRGAAPIQWAIIDGQKETGITTMKMDAGLDTGDILRQYPIAIAEDETGGSLFDRLQKLGGEAILDTLRGIAEGTIRPVRQGEMTTAYASMLTKEMGNLDWNRTAAELERLVRGLYPWPGTYSYLNGKMIKIRRARVEAETADTAALEPGTVICSPEKGMLVRTGSGLLALEELQPEGKKAMDSASYLRGARIAEGSRFTPAKA